MAARFRDSSPDDSERFDDSEFGDDGEFEDGQELEEPTIGCPHCGQEIYEDAEWCPYCGNFLSREDAARRRPPVWLVVGVIVCLAIVLLWTVLG